MKYVIGIDEVGRGPLAGPVVFCACATLSTFDALSLFPKRILKDSKKLTEKQREEIVSSLNSHIQEKQILYGLGEVSASEIDTLGLRDALLLAQKKALENLYLQNVPKDSKLFLDGGLREHRDVEQETFIKGDEKIPVIALASIIAKVYRDAHMKKLAQKYPVYGFERHVGYGTALHRDAIKKHGVTKEHRLSFLKNLLK